jgi:hypothetical protein
MIPVMTLDAIMITAEAATCGDRITPPTLAVVD